jgi:hypothetical protein
VIFLGETAMKTSMVSNISLHISITIITLVAILQGQKDVAKEAIKTLAYSAEISRDDLYLRSPVSSQESLNFLLNNHNRRLLKLKEKEAKLGLHTPPYILTEIEDIEAEMNNIKSQIKTSNLSCLPNLA